MASVKGPAPSVVCLQCHSSSTLYPFLFFISPLVLAEIRGPKPAASGPSGSKSSSCQFSSRAQSAWASGAGTTFNAAAACYYLDHTQPRQPTSAHTSPAIPLSLVATCNLPKGQRGPAPCVPLSLYVLRSSLPLPRSLLQQCPPPAPLPMPPHRRPPTPRTVTLPLKFCADASPLQCISSSEWPTLQATGGFAPLARILRRRSLSATLLAPRLAPQTMCAASCTAASPQTTYPPSALLCRQLVSNAGRPLSRPNSPPRYVLIPL